MMVSLVIDGQQVYAEEGTTILQAARQKGIFIPTLCYHPRLRPLGYCRICLVEVEGISKPVTSCNTPVQEGMEVTTDTPEIRENRAEILSMLLETHPTEECLVCEKAGSCELQEQAYQMGCQVSRSYVLTDEIASADDNPHIVRDPEKCILCGRCIRVCNEITQKFIFDLKEGGMEAKPVAGSADRPQTLENAGCIFCGNCVEVCPVGALTEKERATLGREWELQPIKGICNHCSVGCSVILRVKDNNLVKINADEENDSFGWICSKGKFGYDYIKGEERITTPLIRQGERGSGEFREATWEEAIDYAAKGLMKVRDEDPRALGVLGTGRCTNEESYVLQKFARGVLGTNNLETGMHFGMGEAVLALEESLGISGSTTTLDSLRKAETIMVIGSEILRNQPVAGMRIKEAIRYQGARLININRRETELEEAAHLNLSPRQGSELDLLKGMLNYVIQEGLADEEFIEKYTEGFSLVKDELKEYNPAKVKELTGIKEDDLARAAGWMAQSENAVVLVGGGFVKSSPRENTLALVNFMLGCGQVGREGSGIILVQPRSNVQGALDMGGVPHLLPGYHRVEQEEDRRDIAEFWNMSVPSWEGKGMEGILSEAREGNLKGLYLVGDGLDVSKFEDRKKALSNLDFLVAQELFLTPGARYADVILPGASFVETEGTFTNLERKVQKDQQALPPYGDSRTDLNIMQDLSRAMGVSLSYPSGKEVMEEIASVVPQYGGISWDRLQEEGGLFWPCPEEGHHGTPDYYLERKIARFVQV